MEHDPRSKRKKPALLFRHGAPRLFAIRPSVSLDLLIRSFLALGANRQDLAEAIAGR